MLDISFVKKMNITESEKISRLSEVQTSRNFVHAFNYLNPIDKASTTIICLF